MVRQSIRFSLRTFFLFMLVVAVVIASVPMATRWYIWSSHRDALNDWAAQLQRETNRYATHNIQLPTGQCFSVHNAEVVLVEEERYSYVYSGQPIREDGYFVVPPGKWVDSVPDIIYLWEQHRR